jgi:predicted metalloprotease
VAIAAVVIVKLVHPVNERAAITNNRTVEQVNPPAAAAPAGVPQSEKLEANPILVPGLSLSPVRCNLPDLARTTPALRAFYVAAVECLTKTWAAALAPQGITLNPPGVEVESVASNACGVVPSKDEAVAFYCGAVIYMPRDRLLADAGLSEAIHLQVLAHEFGHHVQDQAKILHGADRRGAGLEPNNPDQLLLSRRVELQANCFSGIFLASAAAGGTINRSTANTAVRSFSEFLSSRTHGSSKNQGRWGRTGFTTNNTNSCNTWTAAPSDVE